MYYAYVTSDGVMDPKGGFQTKKLPIQATDSEVVLTWWPNHRIVSQTFSVNEKGHCLLYTSPSPRDRTRSRMPSSA